MSDSFNSAITAVNKILVTGANGFVGRSLCDKLRQKDLPVRAVIRSPNLQPSQIETVSIDTIDGSTDWSDTLANVDVVFHLASRAHLMNDNAPEPFQEFRRVNVEGTLNLARQCVQAGVRRFIFISSIKVNGENTPLGKKFTADDIPAPVDFYAISKYEAEKGLRQLAAETDMEIVIIRPPLIYGPGVKANFLNMMRWLNKGIPLPLGAVTNKRSLLALPNLIDLLVTCIDHPKAANQIFLVSDDEDLSMTELLHMTAKALGKQPHLLPAPQNLLRLTALLFGKEAFYQRLCESLQIDIKKTADLLDWKPSVTVTEALRITAEAFLDSSQNCN